MTFHLFNTLTRQKELFKPLQEGKVGMYVCGVTPYSYSHIGHARVGVVFDTFYRFLKAQGLQVTYVRNFTDIDDKIIARANETGEFPMGLAERFIEAYHEDMAALRVLGSAEETQKTLSDSQIIEPRVSTHIPDIIELIKKLFDAGIAYQTSSGDVVYDISRFKGNYGELAGKKVEDLLAGARCEVDDEKRHPADFVLWKAAKPGEPSWVSPWSTGRPGWHIECSAMSWRYLGEHFDIHGGGEDLQFPHHENEIAQSEGAHNCRYVNYWMHNAFITVNDEKMSKSGTFTTIRDVVKDLGAENGYSGEALRLWVLGTHYRKPVDFSAEALKAAENSLRGFYVALDKASRLLGEGAVEGRATAGGAALDDTFMAALADDLNTSAALAVMHGLLKDLNKALDADDADTVRVLRARLMAMADVAGLLQYEPQAYLKGEIGPRVDALGDSDADIEKMIRWREEARQAKNFAAADSIRAELMLKGVVLEDTPQGTFWHRAE